MLAPLKADDIDGLVGFARNARFDLVVCGPEGPLAAGLGDAMRAAGIPFFGPSRAAAELEGSKAFAKRLMTEAGVPTAAFGVFDEVAAADRFIDAQPGPVVVKADGLCAGKGVVVASTRDESKAAVRRMLTEGELGAAGARVVLEERLFGREVSLMALCDGERVALLRVRRGSQGRVRRRSRARTPGAWAPIRRRRWWTPPRSRDIVDADLHAGGRGDARPGHAVPGTAVRRPRCSPAIAGRW